MPAPPDTLRELQLGFAAHIRDPRKPAPELIEDRRMAIYRDLFFNNLNGFLSNNFPVIRRTLGAERFTQLVRDFFIQHQCHTPLFPELPREFLQYLQQGRADQPQDPPWLLPLAHWEWAELAVSLLEDEVDLPGVQPLEPQQTEALLDQQPVLSPVAWLCSYDWPVQRIGPDFQPGEPLPEPVHLLVYRNREDRVRFMALNAVAARLVSLLQDGSGRSGRAYLQALAAEMGIDDPMSDAAQRIVDAGVQQLAQFVERDILSGVRPATQSTSNGTPT